MIDLESEDDSQKIFETLNSIGTPLLPADLVKNFLFRRAAVSGEDPEGLYLSYWAKFDDDKDYWRKEFRSGLQRRARIDLFLQHYLTLLYGGEAKANQLFQQFRDYCDKSSSSTEAQMRGFRQYSDVYRSFECLPQSTPEGRFFGTCKIWTRLPHTHYFYRYSASGIVHRTLVSCGKRFVTWNRTLSVESYANLKREATESSLQR